MLLYYVDLADVLAYPGMKQLGMPASYAFPGGILVVVGIRLVAIRWHLHRLMVTRTRELSMRSHVPTLQPNKRGLVTVSPPAFRLAG